MHYLARPVLVLFINMTGPTQGCVYGENERMDDTSTSFKLEAVLGSSSCPVKVFSSLLCGT